MVSDQLINIFFQEWAPLFPVLHRPTLLDAYEKYMADPEGIEDQHIIVQLHFIFGIAASSAEVSPPAVLMNKSDKKVVEQA